MLTASSSRSARVPRMPRPLGVTGTAGRRHGPSQSPASQPIAHQNLCAHAGVSVRTLRRYLTQPENPLSHHRMLGGGESPNFTEGNSRARSGGPDPRGGGRGTFPAPIPGFTRLRFRLRHAEIVTRQTTRVAVRRPAPERESEEKTDVGGREGVRDGIRAMRLERGADARASLEAAADGARVRGEVRVTVTSD